MVGPTAHQVPNVTWVTRELSPPAWRLLNVNQPIEPSKGRVRIMRRNTFIRTGVVVAGAAIAVFGAAAPASAHVTVSAQSAVQGGYTKVTFRVPTEKDTASTVKVEVFLPQDQPIASVSTKPVPGWTAAPETTKLAKPITT